MDLFQFFLFFALVIFEAEAKMHMPRTFRPRDPFLGIKELNPPGPRDEHGGRRYVHKVDNERIHIEYDVTMQEGLHSLDEDMNIVHISCHDDLSTLDLHVTDLDEVTLRLQSSN